MYRDPSDNSERDPLLENRLPCVVHNHPAAIPCSWVGREPMVQPMVHPSSSRCSQAADGAKLSGRRAKVQHHLENSYSAFPKWFMYATMPMISPFAFASGFPYRGPVQHTAGCE